MPKHFILLVTIQHSAAEHKKRCDSILRHPSESVILSVPLAMSESVGGAPGSYTQVIDAPVSPRARPPVSVGSDDSLLRHTG